jgi:hypothetical protein
MVETEREYVKSLNYIIKHYLPEMERNDIPATLRGHRHGFEFDLISSKIL